MCVLLLFNALAISLLLHCARDCLLLVFAPNRTYRVQTRVNGERVRYCDKDRPPRPNSPDLDCDSQDPVLTVVHGELDATRCSLVEFPGQAGLEENPVGEAAEFSIVSKDSFGNTRYVRVCGARVQNDKLGDSSPPVGEHSLLPVCGGWRMSVPLTAAPRAKSGVLCVHAGTCRE